MTAAISVIFVLLVWLLPALLAARVANAKGREGANYLVAGLFVGGPIVLIAALARRRQQDHDQLSLS
jgi:hypothetical protein